MKNIFLFFIILVLMSSIALAIPVTYKGIIDYDDINSTNILKASSATGDTQISIKQTEQKTPFVINHLGNENEKVDFYFGSINILTKTQPKPGTIVDMGNITVPFGKPIIYSKNPANNTVDMTELESTTFSIVANDSKGAALDYFWYKNDVLVSTKEAYTFVGNNTNTGSNSGTYTIKTRVYNKLSYSDYVSWTLNVNRIRDSDGDGVADDNNDNCPFVANTDQADSNADGIGDACAGDEDGDGINDTEDSLIGDTSLMTTNVGNINLEVGNSLNLSQQFSGSQTVNFTNGTDSIVEFNFDFSEGNLSIPNITIQQQGENASAGGIIISGIDLTSQGETKTVFFDRKAGENYVCVKDAEIASITELPSASCSGSGEIPVPCSTTGSSASGYTCAITGNKFKVEGLRHSGISESTYTPPSSPSSDGGTSSTGGGSGGGGSLPLLVEADNQQQPAPVKPAEEVSAPKPAEPAQPSQPAQPGNPEVIVNPPSSNGITGRVIETIQKPSMIIAIVVAALVIGGLYAGRHFLYKKKD